MVGSHALSDADVQFCACLIGKSMFLVLETCGLTRKHCFRNKNVSEFVWKTCLHSGKQNFVFATFPRCGQTDEKRHNLLRALVMRVLDKKFTGLISLCIFAPETISPTNVDI